MSALRAKRKLVLTGTPLQNHVAELWSILSFLDSNKFNDVDAFLERFGKLSTGGGTLEHVNQLNKLIKPHLLRREKDDVENSIPGMKETLLYVEITNLQKMCYRAVLERNRELLLRGAGSGARGVASNPNPHPHPHPHPHPYPHPRPHPLPKPCPGAGGVASTFNNISMMLRHCCNHPWLIQEVEDG